jgi:hypothetical protein
MEAPPEALELRNLWGRRDQLPEDAPDKIVAGLDAERHWTSRLYAARLIPFLSWDIPDQRAVVEKLEQGENLFVRAWSLDSLSHFAGKDRELADRVFPMLLEALGSSSGAVRARAKVAIKRLA